MIRHAKIHVPPDIRLDATIHEYEKAKVRLEDLKRSNEDTWKQVKVEIDKLYDDLDEDLRETLACFG